MRDTRLKNLQELINEKYSQEYEQPFRQNNFPGLELVVNWLKDQLADAITGSQFPIKISFEQNLPDNLRIVLSEGDAFFSRVFDESGLISEESREHRIQTPFSTKVKSVYNNIWKIRNDRPVVSLTVYENLEKHIEGLLARKIGQDERFNTLAQWMKVRSVTYQFHDFYAPWIDSISKTTIDENIERLIEIEPDAKLDELASLIGFSRDAKRVAVEYELSLRKLSAESDWSFVDKATSNSDITHLSDALHFKEDLILKTGLENWTLWLDNLRYPILQDNVFFRIQDLDAIEQIMCHIVDEQLQLKTKRQHLLLICLKNYYELVLGISNNLFDLKNREPEHHNYTDSVAIIANAQAEYGQWMQQGIKSSYKKLLDIIFGGKPASGSKYFPGVFNWSNSLREEMQVGKPYETPAIATHDILNEVFQSFLHADIRNAFDIVRTQPLDNFNWAAFDKFVSGLSETSPDPNFENLLFQKYAEYLDSDLFRWNTSLLFHSYFINQSYRFAFLIARLPGPLQTWSGLVKKFSFAHEGWNPTPRGDQFWSKRKEIFILTTGVCLSYVFYKAGNRVDGRSFIDETLRSTLKQYRVAVHEGSNYLLPLRVLLACLSTHEEEHISEFLENLFNKLDREEDFLMIVEMAHGIYSGDRLKLNDALRHSIIDRLSNRFWIVEKRYSKLGPEFKSRLSQYIRIKDEILMWAQSIDD